MSLATNNNAKLVQPKFNTNTFILVIAIFILFTIRMSAPFAITAIIIFLFTLMLFDTYVLKVPCIFSYRIDFECPCCGQTTYVRLGTMEKNIKKIDHIKIDCKNCNNTYNL
jgi:hypothetical protein